MDSAAWAAPLLACIATLGFGVQSVLVRRGMNHVDSPTGSVVSMGTTTLVFLLLGPWWMRSGDWFTTGFWIFLLNGCMHPLISLSLYYEAVKRTGATIAATFAATAPLFAAATAIFVFGEALTPLRVLGTVLAVAGVMTLSWQAGRVRGVVGMALLFATGTAIVRALSQNVGKWGLEFTPSPFMAGFVSFSLSFAIAVAIYAYRLRKPQTRAALRQVRWQGVAWCVAAGTSSAVGISCMYSALAVGDVMLVSPFVSANPVVALIVGWVFGLETLSGRARLAVLLTLAGVVAVVLGVPR